MLTRDFYESCRRKSIKDSRQELNNYIGGAKTGLNVAWWLISKQGVNRDEKRILDALVEPAPDNSTVLFRVRQVVIVEDMPRELLEVDYKKIYGTPSLTLLSKMPDMDYVSGVTDGYSAGFEMFFYYQIMATHKNRLKAVRELEAYIMRQRKMMDEFIS